MRTLPHLLLLVAGCTVASNDTGRASFADDEDWSGGESDADSDADSDSDSDSDADTTTTPPPEGDTGELEPTCDDAVPEELTLYLSADDSNSQAAATYARAAIEAGLALTQEQRTWEFLNYYDFPFAPAEDGTVRVEAQMREIPGEPGSYDLLVAVVAPRVDPEARRPLNLTFSLDTSGSMSGEPLDLAKATMEAIASELHEGDIVSIVTWNVDTTIALDSHVVDGPDDPVLLDAVADLAAGGSTNLARGLEVAYELAAANYSTGRTNRVVLVSDGGANTGVTDEALIADNAEDAEGEGIYLIGVGTGAPGSYSDQLMDTVTDEGKGAYLYVDSASEAIRSFTGERLVANLEIAARDVRLSMTLPPEFVVQEFHGEEISTNPDAVKPQHLAPNDAMLYHMVLLDCGDARDGTERFAFSVDWDDPRTGEVHTTDAGVTLAEMLDTADTEILKAQAIVAYAASLSAVWTLPEAERAPYMEGVYDELVTAFRARPSDGDLAEIVDLVDAYRARF